MLNQRQKTKLNLSNPYLFWGIIILLLMAIFFLNNSLKETHSNTKEKNESSIVERSYKDSSSPIVVDVENLKHMDFEKHQPTHSAETSYNTTLLLLLLYTVAISILFVYREKQNRVKLFNIEKIDDAIKIKQAEKESESPLYEYIKDDLIRHKDIIEPELKLEKIEEELADNPRYVIVNSRIILEKTILKIYFKNFNETKTLNEMLFILKNKKILSLSLNNYAHTIKAFGNKACHPTVDPSLYQKPKDALLVLNTLLQYLHELKSANLLEH